MHLKTQLYYFIRNNLFFKNWFEFYQQTWKYDSDSCKDLLQKLLFHAREKVPYYKDKIPENEEIEKILPEIPVLRKSDIREHFESLKSLDIKNRNVSLQSSGGSTGKPITLIIDKAYSEWLIASENYYYKKYMGFLFAEPKKIILWGAHRDIKQFQGIRSKISHYLSNTSLLNAFEVSDKQFDEFVEAINTQKPDLIRSFAGSLFLLAEYIKKKNIKIFKPKYLGTSAETLRPFMRKTIEEVFETRVRDYYGSREVGIIAAECANGKMHTFPFFNHVEVVDHQGIPVKPGEEGYILVTGVRNYSMPLIRYEIGDMAILGDSCSCGGYGPILETVTGRISDHFVKQDGSLVHGQFFTRMFYFNKWIAEFQILQKSYDLIEIYFVPNANIEASETEKKEINEKILVRMGSNCHIKWIQVETIPKSESGKRLFTRSLIFHNLENQKSNKDKYENSYNCSSR